MSDLQKNGFIQMTYVQISLDWSVFKGLHQKVKSNIDSVILSLVLELILVA